MVCWFCVGFVVAKCYRDDLSFFLLPDCFLFTVFLADSGVAAAVGVVSSLSFSLCLCRLSVSLCRLSVCPLSLLSVKRGFYYFFL